MSFQASRNRRADFAGFVRAFLFVFTDDFVKQGGKFLINQTIESDFPAVAKIGYSSVCILRKLFAAFLTEKLSKQVKIIGHQTHDGFA